MEEDDHDELLQCSDDDSLSESDDQCGTPSHLEKSEGVVSANFVHHPPHTKVEFLMVKLTLVLSSAAVVILLPLLQESVNVKSDVYSALLFVSAGAAVLMLVFLIVFRRWVMPNRLVSKLPMKLSELVTISVYYTSAGFAIVYALDRKRVMCHLQDPIKGIVLVFSLVYYFFFCKKLMGLQRIFSATTIIVGLFISVDYGLCDEFRCRGNERDHKSDDGGDWPWETHTMWVAVYIAGLSLFAGFYLVLDRCLICCDLIPPVETYSSRFLTTISRMVSNPVNSETVQQVFSYGTFHINKKEFSALHIAFWLHFVNFFVTLALCWTGIIPEIGKSESLSSFMNQTAKGLDCLISTDVDCGNFSLYAWPFLVAYVCFHVSSIRFLILCQSCVYTVATMTLSLPLAGICWSLFKMVHVNKGLIIWAPSISGELICALLGLPIVLIGLALFCKSHFNDYQHYRNEQVNAQVA